MEVYVRGAQFIGGSVILNRQECENKREKENVKKKLSEVRVNKTRNIRIT